LNPILLNVNRMVRNCALTLWAAVVLFSSMPAGAEEWVRTTLKVSDLFCGACITHIEAELKSMDGFLGMTGNVKGATVTVDHRPELDAGRIVSSVNEIGYGVKSVHRQLVSQKPPPLPGSDRSGLPGCCAINKPSYRECGASASAWKKIFKMTFNPGN